MDLGFSNFVSMSVGLLLSLISLFCLSCPPPPSPLVLLLIASALTKLSDPTRYSHLLFRERPPSFTSLRFQRPRQLQLLPVGLYLVTPRVGANTWFPWSVASSPLRPMLVDPIYRLRVRFVVMLGCVAWERRRRRFIQVRQRGLQGRFLYLLSALGALTSATGSSSCSNVIKHP